jgi:hypothetical protein
MMATAADFRASPLPAVDSVFESIGPLHTTMQRIDPSINRMLP